MTTTVPVSLSKGLNALLALALLIALAGCGPASSDEASNIVAPASVGPDNGTGTARGLSPPGTVPLPDAEPVPLSAAARQADKLVLPDWMATDLASPDTQVRLQAVDRWAQQAPTGSVDPLIQALEDKDEQVQARALEWLVQDWARGQRTENSE